MDLPRIAPKYVTIFGNAYGCRAEEGLDKSPVIPGQTAGAQAASTGGIILLDQPGADACPPSVNSRCIRNSILDRMLYKYYLLLEDLALARIADSQGLGGSNDETVPGWVARTSCRTQP